MPLVQTPWGTAQEPHEGHLLSTEPAPAAEAPTRVQNVEDFVPEDGLDHSFLEDTAQSKNEKVGARAMQQDSDR